MTPFVAEILGTMLLLLLGNGVVANVVLRSTKGNGADWLLISAGWGMAVFRWRVCLHGCQWCASQSRCDDCCCDCPGRLQLG